MTTSVELASRHPAPFVGHHLRAQTASTNQGRRRLLRRDVLRGDTIQMMDAYDGICRTFDEAFHAESMLIANEAT
jgi:hypothetical protein